MPRADWSGYVALAAFDTGFGGRRRAADRELIDAAAAGAARRTR